MDAITVTQLNQTVKSLIDGEPSLRAVLVRGEISDYRPNASGHMYFTLKDEGGVVRAVMFRGYASKLRFAAENGMKVVAAGSVSVFLRDGQYQLYCVSIMPEGTGDLQIAFEQLKAKLAGEGLFDEAPKKRLPAFPEKIAIITSSAGAAVHDMIRILGRRWPMTKVILLPVRVQGVEAPPEIAGAIRYANEFHVADLIITGRGGGSIEDLWAFNDERVARAIYASEIPVISAVGHEPDVTISDYVADRRASTPSNAAEIAVPDCDELREALASLQIRSEQALRKTLSALRDRLESMRQKRVLTDPTSSIDDRRMLVDRSRDRLCASMEKLLAGKKQLFVASASALDAMSPLRVLGRGYALAADAEGHPLTRASALKPSDRIRLRFSDGTAACTVDKIELHE